MSIGRPQKPLEQKRVTARSATRDSAGRPLPQPVVALAASITTPRLPKSLGDAGRDAWERLWAAGGAWLSVEADRDVLVRLCAAHDQYEAICGQIASDGLMVVGSTGQPVAHPLLAALRTLETLMTKYESELGFSPTARARLGYAEVKRVSKLDDLMERHSRRSSA